MAQALAKEEKAIKTSISSIYADLLTKRKAKEEMKKEQKRMEKELHEQEKADKEAEEGENKMSKKERRQADLDNWKAIVIGLTGDDIEYSDTKKSKKKYRKWIDDDDFNSMITAKKKKPKKKNFHKEFEPQLNMLKATLAEQNRFTADLQKRFQIAAGPATKDAQYPNKTLIELASAINAGRTNSLGMLREIGNLNKTIAELYMKQKKLDADLGNSGSVDNTDIELMGSNIAASIFNRTPYPQETYPQNNVAIPTAQDYNVQPIQPTSPIPQVTPIDQPMQIQEFDPSSWNGPELESSYSNYENIPHTIMVEKDMDTGNLRFVAIDDATGEELSGCPVPTSDPSRLKVNEETKTVKGEFDEVYQLKYK